MTKLGRTPSQTVGPYFSMCLFEPGQNVLVPGHGHGHGHGHGMESRKIRVFGGVYDADRKAMDDALLEVWQSDSEGVYRHPFDGRAGVRQGSPFSGFGRSVIEPETLEYSFETIKPGRVPAPDGSLQAPHLSVIVQGRGILRPLFTRAYFADEAEANERDLVLRAAPPARRRSLMASLVSRDPIPAYRFDIHLQGPDETVFFDFEP